MPRTLLSAWYTSEFRSTIPPACTGDESEEEEAAADVEDDDDDDDDEEGSLAWPRLMPYLSMMNITVDSSASPHTVTALLLQQERSTFAYMPL